MKVCVVSPGYSKGFVSALAYGDGKIRTYEVDELDPRIGDDTPVLVTVKEVRQFIKDHGPDDSCVIPVDVAKQMFGWKDREFDQY